MHSLPTFATGEFFHSFCVVNLFEDGVCSWWPQCSRLTDTHTHSFEEWPTEAEIDSKKHDAIHFT